MKNLPKFNNYNHIHFASFKTFGKMVIDKDGNKYYQGYPFFKDEKCCEILIEELNFYRQKLEFKLLGYVIMPNHIHLLVWWDIEKFPELTIGKIMRSIKTVTSKRVKSYLLYNNNDSWLNNLQTLRPPRVVGATSLQLPCLGENSSFRFWQENFYDFNIFTPEKLQEKLDYIHKNPLRAGLVESPNDYKWSSYNSLYNNDDSIIKIDQMAFY